MLDINDYLWLIHANPIFCCVDSNARWKVQHLPWPGWQRSRPRVLQCLCLWQQPELWQRADEIAPTTFAARPSGGSFHHPLGPWSSWSSWRQVVEVGASPGWRRRSSVPLGRSFHCAPLGNRVSCRREEHHLSSVLRTRTFTESPAVAEASQLESTAEVADEAPLTRRVPAGGTSTVCLGTDISFTPQSPWPLVKLLVKFTVCYWEVWILYAATGCVLALFLAFLCRLLTSAYDCLRLLYDA